MESRQFMKIRKNKFTLIELLVVIAIIGVLLAGAEFTLQAVLFNLGIVPAP